MARSQLYVQAPLRPHTVFKLGLSGNRRWDGHCVTLVCGYWTKMCWVVKILPL
jgi:hypothetical protein